MIISNSRTRGFTLIELLVVIAIIGVLSSVVLASINTARTKGNDAAIRSNLSTVATQAALYVDDNFSYGFFDLAGAPDVCPSAGGSTGSLFDDATIAQAIASAVTGSGGGTSLCIATDDTYAVSVDRPLGFSSGAWCVDSAGTKCGVDASSHITAGLCTTPCVSGD